MPERPHSDRADSGLEQLLTGLTPRDACGSVYCTACGGRIQDGSDIIVIAQRPADSCRWTIPRVYCQPCYTGCRPTLGVRTVGARARLGSMLVPTGRTHRPCLTEVAVLWVSPPAEAGEGERR